MGLAPRTGWLTSLAGALGVAMFVLFAIELYRLDGGQAIDMGAWLVLAGSVVAVIAGFLGSRHGWSSPRPDPLRTVRAAGRASARFGES